MHEPYIQLLVQGYYKDHSMLLVGYCGTEEHSQIVYTVILTLTLIHFFCMNINVHMYSVSESYIQTERYFILFTHNPII